MKRITTLYSFLLVCCLTTGCELIMLGGKPRKKLPDIDQNTAQGAVLLFKAELDSNNVPAASRMFVADTREHPLLAIQKYEMRDEIARIGRLIFQKSITEMKVDTLATDRHRIHTEFNYTRQLTFTTIRVNDVWFICSIIE